MKFFLFFLFILFVSCTTVKKTYICGERPCIDKREFNEFFSKNLIVEIQTKKLKKNSSVDLVKLNLSTPTKKKNNIISAKLKDKRKKKKKKKKKK